MCALASREGQKAQLKAENKENLEEKLRKMQLSMAKLPEQSTKENVPHHQSSLRERYCSQTQTPGFRAGSNNGN